MRAMKMKKAISISKLFPVVTMALALLFAASAHAAAPGIKGQSFALTAQAAYLNQPDGEQVYSWGYGCATGFVPTFAPTAIAAPAGGCPLMQVPGPTLIVTEGQLVTITLINQLPTAAGNTSLLFSGFNVTATGGVTGLLTHEAPPGGATTVTYTFTPSSPGTHAYYSGTQGDLQIEMGLYGAIIVLPSAVPANCNTGLAAQNLAAEAHWGEADYRLANAAYDHPETCYDREYLFQFAEMDANIHHAAFAQVNDPKRIAACATTATAPGCSLEVPTEPYAPQYYLINGRSMPDDMDGNYAAEYPHQPYNGNPHMHPGEQVLIRVIGQGRWEHPFHEHGNHVRILARDGNLLRGVSDSANTPDLSGLLMFTTDTFPGQSFDGIFYWTGRGLNWDAYGHNPASPDAKAKLPCTPDANGYNTIGAAATAINYYEWCQDHNKPLQVAPFGDVAAGGPATLPDPNIFTNGPWYGGSPYLGPDATLRAVAPACAIATNANCSSQQPSNTQANPANERGYAFMWHSHNEREITTNNVFPGGMLMMMLVDSREFVINESN
jgi:FtsP/CotA-like multicopper oxidase with cupredoxin domain